MTVMQQFFMGVGFLTTLALIVAGIWKLRARADTYGDRLMRKARRKAARRDG